MYQEAEATASAEARGPATYDLVIRRAHVFDGLKSVGDPTGGILDTRAGIAEGTLRGPRLLATGCGITGRDGHPAATVFGDNPWARERFSGTVARGKRADLLVLDADPTADIGNLRRLRMVILNGELAVDKRRAVSSGSPR
ncbi:MULTISPECIES: hypothetical protein [Streptomyces rochei group]|uniref:Amidohydrolase-related domain-containing protein n=1 Tax=Streptomyces plicatus TaxID=1922 RepID=A0ABW1XUY3_STRPL|nr:hypothetical protein [Streptomyces plicatus]GGZ78685.1 hypothetical protein GCM10010301_60030 [Streptomyces plicatus]